MGKCNVATCKGGKCKNNKTHGDSCGIHVSAMCGVCLETDFTRNMFNLHCKHSFCPDCISKWVCINYNTVTEDGEDYIHTCPMCRTEIQEITIRLAITHGLDIGFIQKVEISVLPISMVTGSYFPIVPLNTRINENYLKQIMEYFCKNKEYSVLFNKIVEKSWTETFYEKKISDESVFFVFI